MMWYGLSAGGILLALIGLYNGNLLLVALAAVMIFAGYKLHEHEDAPRR